MTEEHKQALIEHIETDLELLRNVTLKHCHEVERECVLRDIEVNEIALAALTTPEYWKQRAEAAEAKLAGLEKQEPAGYAVKRFDNGKFGSWLKSKGLAKGDADYYVVPLFERPTPAADLVPEGWKLVPVEPTKQML